MKFMGPGPASSGVTPYLFTPDWADNPISFVGEYYYIRSIIYILPEVYFLSSIYPPGQFLPCFRFLYLLDFCDKGFFEFLVFIL